MTNCFRTYCYMAMLLLLISFRATAAGQLIAMPTIAESGLTEPDRVETYAMWRVQLEIHTCDERHASTNDPVWVHLESDPVGGTRFYLDRPGDDFARDSWRAYDVLAPELVRIADLDALWIGIDGRDGWCFDEVVLVVNDQPLYIFQAASGEEVWLDNDGSIELTGAYDLNLMDQSNATFWTSNPLLDAATQIPNIIPPAFAADSMARRIEGYVGDMINHENQHNQAVKDFGYLTWKYPDDGEYVTVTNGQDEDAVHVRVDLGFMVDDWNDVEIDVDFDILFECGPNGEFQALIQNVEVEKDIKQFDDGAFEAAFAFLDFFDDLFGASNIPDDPFSGISELKDALTNSSFPLPEALGCPEVRVLEDGSIEHGVTLQGIVDVIQNADPNGVGSLITETVLLAMGFDGDEDGFVPTTEWVTVGTCVAGAWCQPGEPLFGCNTCTMQLCATMPECCTQAWTWECIWELNDTCLDPDMACGADADYDQVFDDVDNCPGPTVAWSNPDQEDADGDGIGDLCDMCWTSASNTDADEDGIGDSCDVCPNTYDPWQIDSDGDLVGNACDNDDDGDDESDAVDSCPLQPNVGDLDGDSIDDACDNCPFIENPQQEDVDFDGIGNMCDTDNDGDGVDDLVDNCPDHPNPEQGDVNQDGIGDLCYILEELEQQLVVPLPSLQGGPPPVSAPFAPLAPPEPNFPYCSPLLDPHCEVYDPSSFDQEAWDEYKASGGAYHDGGRGR